jgi:predicted aconitase
MRSLCASTCDAAELSFREAIMRHVGDKYQIPAANRVQDKRVVNALKEVGIHFKSMCQPYSSKDSNCVKSIKSESNYCGKNKAYR